MTEWTQLTPSTPLPAEAEWKMRFFAMYYDTPTPTTREVVWNNKAGTGRRGLMDFSVAREVDASIDQVRQCVNQSVSSDWCRTAVRDEVWRCFVRPYQQVGESAYAQILFCPAMGDFVMK